MKGIVQILQQMSNIPHLLDLTPYSGIDLPVISDHSGIHLPKGIKDPTQVKKAVVQLPTLFPSQVLNSGLHVNVIVLYPDKGENILGFRLLLLLLGKV